MRTVPWDTSSAAPQNPFINALASHGANMIQSYAETHLSEPNYLVLFAGNTFGMIKDSCPINTGNAPNLGSELLSAGYTFVCYAEDSPAVGSPFAARASTPASTCRGPTSPMCHRPIRCRSPLSRGAITPPC